MRVDAYDWEGGREAMLRFGPDTGPVLVVAMPLLEEWNRTRAFVVTLLRALAERGIASTLPDLPGHGESLAELPDLGTLRRAIAAAIATAGDRAATLAIRSGALVTAPDRPCWQLSPQTGADLHRELERTRRAAGNESERIVAGWPLPATFMASLDAAPATEARVVRLATDPRPADRHVEGPPLWRRTEPGNDPALATLLAGDIAAWLVTCDV